MKDFYICFINRSEYVDYLNPGYIPDEDITGDKRYYCKLRVGKWERCFAPVANFWNHEDYERQWYDGLKRIINGHNISALACSIPDISDDNNIVQWWSIWKEYEKVYIQLDMELISEMKKRYNDDNIDLKNIYKYIGSNFYKPEFEMVTGNSTTVEALKSFLIKNK